MVTANKITSVVLLYTRNKHMDAKINSIIPLAIILNIKFFGINLPEAFDQGLLRLLISRFHFGMERALKPLSQP